MPENILTDLSDGSIKKTLIMISNSPQPDSLTSYGGLVITGLTWITKKD